MNKVFSLMVALVLMLSLEVPVQTAPQTCFYWVAPEPEGNDENPGTFEYPWATLQHAGEAVPDTGCTVWFKPGVYFGEHRLTRRFEFPVLFKSINAYRAVLEFNGPVVSISGGKNITLEGFDIRHSGPDAAPLVVAIDSSRAGWAEQITLRNNIIHDSYNNDLLKIYNGARFVTVEGNLFFNQGTAEEQMDVNGVTDVVIQDNIFFNDFAASGRENNKGSKQFIVIKDSNGGEDGVFGSRRVTVRRNIFLNWQGNIRETFVQVGLDGKPYHEAGDVHVESNLFIGNAQNQIGSVFGVKGARDVYFVNNTITGDLPAQSYAMRLNITEQNPKNQNIYFYNNIWSDPTGSMGADFDSSPNEFSDGRKGNTLNLVLDNNLYWNGGREIPDGDALTPLFDDLHPLVADPLLNTDQKAIILPHWDGASFQSGAPSIRQEFIRLVKRYATIPASSPAVDHANPEFAPSTDILRRPWRGLPDIGAFEH